MISETERAFNELVESFVERYRRGERPSLSELTQQHPEHAERIEKFLPSLVMMEELAPNENENAATPWATTAIAGLDSLQDYQILREVGRGGMGVVYEAKQESLGRHVALKVLPFHGLMDSIHLKRFQREARAAARLHHTNIVPVFEVGEHEGIHYYAMQFIRGQGLDEVMSDLMAMRRRLHSPSSAVVLAENRGSDDDPGSDTTSSSGTHSGLSALSGSTTSDFHYFRSVARVGAQVADALFYAHEEGILHRDVKPSNLMLDTDGKVWVTDFGLAKTDAKEDLTHTGDLVGTLRYMAPERFDGWSDPRSDIYGLGLTLYEMLTLRSAFNESDRGRLIKRITDDELPRPRRVDRNIPVDLETIVLKSIAREPGERYQSADGLARDLRRFLNNEPINARRTSLPERTRMWCRRNPLVASLTAAVGLLLVAVAIGATLSTIWLRDERNQALTNLARAESAERTTAASATRERDARLDAQRSLYAARLAQAHAGRWSNQMGRRFEGLKALTEAAQLAHDLDLGDDAMRELRNEAIACMALVDLRVDREWPSDAPTISRGIAYDADLERYSRLEYDDFVIRRMDDDAEITRLAAFGDPTTGELFTRFSPDGRYFAAKRALTDARIQVVVWDLNNGQEVFRGLAGGKTFYPNLDFSSDGRFLAYLTAAGEIGLHNFVASETLQPIPCPPLICIRFAPEGLQLAAVEHVAENGKGRVLIIDLNRREVVQTMEHERRIDLAAWGPAGKTLATPGFDGGVYIWDVVTGQRRQMSGKHNAPARLADYSPTGDLLVSMASEPGNRVWDPHTGRQLLETEQALIEFSRDGRWLSSNANSSGSRSLYSAIRLEVAAPRECRTLVGHSQNSEVVSLSFSPDGRLLASAPARGNVRIWDVARARELASIATRHRCRFAVFDRSGRSLISVSDIVAAWPVNTQTGGREQVVRIGPPELVASSRLDWERMASLAKNETTLAVPSLQGEILFINLGEVSQRIAARTGCAGLSATISACGKWFATGSRNRSTIEIRDAATGAIEKRFSAPKGSHVQFSPDGKWLVGSIRPGQIVFWRVGSWQESHRVQLDGRGFSRMAFSRDCRLMAVTDSYHVTLLDPANGREIARLSSPHREQLSEVIADSTSGIAFSPDDSTLAVGSTEGPIQLWDLRLIRKQLAEMGLDWDYPPIPPAANGSHASSGDVSTPAGTEGEPATVRVDVVGAESLGFLAELATLNKALEDDPNNFDALLRRVKFFWALGRYEAMIQDSTRMIELRPEEHHGLVWRAFPLMMLERYEESIRDYQQARVIRPDNGWPMRHLAWMYLRGPEQVRDVNRARKLAEQAVKLKRTPLFLATLGAVCYRQGEFETARKHLQRAASSTVDDDSQTLRLLFLAMTQHRLKRPTEAQQSYIEALRQVDRRVTLKYLRTEEVESLRAEAETILNE